MRRLRDRLYLIIYTVFKKQAPSTVMLVHYELTVRSQDLLKGGTQPEVCMQILENIPSQLHYCSTGRAKIPCNYRGISLTSVV